MLIEAYCEVLALVMDAILHFKFLNVLKDHMIFFFYESILLSQIRSSLWDNNSGIG